MGTQAYFVVVTLGTLSPVELSTLAVTFDGVFPTTLTLKVTGAPSRMPVLLTTSTLTGARTVKFTVEPIRALNSPTIKHEIVTRHRDAVKLQCGAVLARQARCPI